MRTCWLAFPKPVALTCDWKTRMSGVLKVHIESGCGNSLEVRHQDIHADSTRSHRVMDLDVETEVLPVFCKEKGGACSAYGRENGTFPRIYAW